MARGVGEMNFLSDSVSGSLSAYASGDAIGGVSSTSLRWLQAGGHIGAGMIAQLVITLNTATAADIELLIYNDEFTAGTDNDAFAENSADLAKCAGSILIPASEFRAVNGNLRRATITDMPIIYRTAAGDDGTLYGQLVARGALTLADAVITVALGVLKG